MALRVGRERSARTWQSRSSLKDSTLGKCTPHFGMGMIGFIVVGDPSVNIEEVEVVCYDGRAKKVAAELIEQIKAGL